MGSLHTLQPQSALLANPRKSQLSSTILLLAISFSLAPVISVQSMFERREEKSVGGEEDMKRVASSLKH